MTTRLRVITTLRQAKAPGVTLAELATLLGVTPCAAFNHMKHIRKAHTIIANPDPQSADRRFKRYHMTPPATFGKADYAASITQPAPRVDLSAEQMEAAICQALRDKATRRYPMNMDHICDQISQPSALVRPAVTTLVQRETVVRVKAGYFMAPSTAPAKSSAPLQVAGPRCVDIMHTGTYSGAELRAFTGRAGAMDAYSLPSRGIKA